MKKAAFIIPYFGKFNSYFYLYLKSCEYNTDCDWIIFTDDRTEYPYPDNVKVHYWDWEEMKKFVQSKFEFPVVLERPYKLCDYKAAYGYIFEDYLGAYRFWGYCDLDQIWGATKVFLKDEVLNSSDKIFDLGHCTLYRNTLENNRMFMKKLNGRERFREVYQTEENLSFDEEYRDSINNIYLQEGRAIYTKSFAANIYTKSSNFRLTAWSDKQKKYLIEKKTDSFFVWHKGHLYRMIKKNGEMEREEYLYLHMQSRPMKVKLSSMECNTIKIIPNAFEDLEIRFENITEENFDQIKKKNFNLHYFRLRSKNLVIKMKRKMLGWKKSYDTIWH